MNLPEFIASPYRNLYIDEPGITYYVRKSLRFEGVIELANCSARDTGDFGFYRFIKRYSTTIPFYMEQVLNPDIASYMRRLGWAELDIGGVPQFFSPLCVERFHDNDMFVRMMGKN